jgi:hypothetical protein
MYNYTWRIPLAFISPCQFPFPPPFVPFYLLGTLLAVTGIVNLGLRLLVNWPLLPHPSPKPSPLQIPRTPTVQRLTKTTSGIIRLLLSGTHMVRHFTLKKPPANITSRFCQGPWACQMAFLKPSPFSIDGFSKAAREWQFTFQNLLQILSKINTAQGVSENQIVIPLRL